MTDKIKIGDKVFCLAKEFFGVTGVVIKMYCPTGCEEQTMIKCDDGRRFHAPTKTFALINEAEKLCSKNVVNILSPSIDEMHEIIDNEIKKMFARNASRKAMK